MYLRKNDKKRRIAAGLVAGVLAVGMVAMMVVSALWGAV